jgi:hypothetical protein
MQERERGSRDGPRNRDEGPRPNGGNPYREEPPRER